MNIPNILTILRILSIPLFILLYLLPYENSHIHAGAVFIVSSLTDFFDGYLARATAQTTEFGKFLDPVADKLMVMAALLLIISSNSQTILLIPAIVMIGREITVSSLREWMAEIGLRHKVNVLYISKIKTTMQCIAISGLLIFKNVINQNFTIYCILLIILYIALGLTIWSMIVYLKAAWNDLKLSVMDIKHQRE
jgi:CDP-diacylglycerol---glycerol-3-phosphate 3-phosphatidyltransferase